MSTASRAAVLSSGGISRADTPRCGMIEVVNTLPEWRLYLAALTMSVSPDAAAIRAVVREEADATRRRFADAALSLDPIVRATRSAHRRSGADPTKHRPAYEALARRILKGADLPEIHPIVDVNNAISLACRVPCCVGDASAIKPPLLLRGGGTDDRFESFRGDFTGDGKPLLLDADGPIGTPVVDAERVKVRPDTQEVLFWAYVPTESDLDPSPVLGDVLARTGAATRTADSWARASG